MFKELFEADTSWGVYKHKNDDDAVLVKSYKTEKSAEKASKKLEDKDDGYEYYWGKI